VAVHDEVGDQAALYVLGVLTSDETRVFEAHLAVCERCAAEVRALVPVVTALGHAVPPANPSPDVRRTLLARVGRTASPRGSWFGWLAAAAAMVLAAGLGSYAGQLRGRVSVLEARLHEAMLRADASERQTADARRVAVRAESYVAVLAAPDLARIDLAGQPVAVRASARAFWSRSRGLVFTASNLPAPPSGRTYQLWVLTGQPAPISAGLMKPDANGRVSTIFDTPQDLPKPVAMAVTLEPEGGVPAPTGVKYLVGLAN
jgi:anti-sigma-K factor RskA